MEGPLAEIISIVIGFVLTTLVGGWWARRLQDRSWDRQNELRLNEDEAKLASEVCHRLSTLLDKRLYRMRRLYWALEGFHRDGATEEALNERVADYNTVLYEWNDSLNLNLARVGSHFGAAAREFLYYLYERFRSVGARLESALARARQGEDVSPSLRELDAEFEGWEEGSLDNQVYLLGLAMMTQLREERVGRRAPDKLPTPALRT
jgi:hypothetical protein